MKILSYIITFLLFLSCQSNHSTKQTKSENHDNRDTTMQLGTLSIVLPSSWKRIPDDSLPNPADMTARYQIRTSTGDTIFLLHGFSAWDLSIDDSADYVRENDTLFGRKAVIFRTKSEIDNIVGVFVDSVGEIKPVGYYGFSAYGKRLQNNAADSFWKVIRSIKLHPL